MPRVTLDHLVVPVDAVDRAQAAWRGAGHDVRPGGRHEGAPTENALIPVGDGTYIELLGPVRPTWRPRLQRLWRASRWPSFAARRTPLAARLLRVLAAVPPVADVCLAVTPLKEQLAAALGAGLDVPEPEPMGRARPDGLRLAWRLALPPLPALPFAIEDGTARALRVPRVSPDHQGLTLVQAHHVDIGVAGVREATTWFGAWLARRPAGVDPVVFVLDDGCALRLIEVGEEGVPGVLAAEYVARRAHDEFVWRFDVRHDNS
ncbi:MAG: VOC family protein [Acidobacteria bacterium]|nr:VOC family protein [Acidobacteriota bacterium]